MRIGSAFFAVTCGAMIAQAALAAGGSGMSEQAQTVQVPTLTAGDLDIWLDGFLPYALQQDDIAGAVVVVVKDGKVLTERGYGYANVSTRVAMDPRETIVGVGSVSKTFVWTAVMQLVQTGELNLDQDINGYLDFKVPPAFGRPITLRNLMTHSAGFNARTFRDAPAGTKPRDLGEYLKGTPVPARIYPPGTVSAYSNYGAMLAGYIVQRVSGEPFADYVQRHILEPLHMTHSTFMRPLPAASKRHLSLSYTTATEGPYPSEDQEEPVGDPSGHLTSTADDMAHFMIAQLQSGQYGAASVLEPQTAILMHTLAFRPPPIVKGMTLGFFRMDRNGHVIIGHPGDIAGFHADMELLINDGVGIFVSLNSDGAPGGALFAGNSLRFALVQMFMDRYFPAVPGPMEPTVSTAKRDSKLVTGEYWVSQKSSGNFVEALELLANYFQIHLGITAHPDGTISTPSFMSFQTGHPEVWREVGRSMWKQVGGRDRMQMLVEDGQVKAFATSNIPAAFDFQRVPFLWSGELNVPLLLSAMFVLIAGAIAWPLAYVVRRHYCVALKLSSQERRARLSTNLCVVLTLVYGLAWLPALSTMTTVGEEGWIRLAQALGVLCIGGLCIAVWHAWTAVRGEGSWWSKASSVLLALAMAEVVWFSFAFHLLSVNLNY